MKPKKRQNNVLQDFFVNKQELSQYKKLKFEYKD